jgi:hypothetical protein
MSNIESYYLSPSVVGANNPTTVGVVTYPYLTSSEKLILVDNFDGTYSFMTNERMYISGDGAVSPGTVIQQSYI